MSHSESLAALLGRITRNDGAYRLTIPESWMQGRTAYGGLSAALALEVARRDFPDLPPLRSAQIAFVGPLAGQLEIRSTLLRRGRTAAYVQSDLHADGRLGLRAMLVFMQPQQSHVDLPPDVLAVLPDRGSPVAPPPMVRFAGHFELRDAVPVPAVQADILRWVRLRERGEEAPDVALMAVADMLPPAAITLFQRHGPISSMTWQVNLLTDEIRTDDGWWLLRATADHAQHGSSSQTMSIRNSRGALVATGMQSVALFV